MPRSNGAPWSSWRRGDEAIIPDGGTELHEGDRLLVLADEHLLAGLRDLVQGVGDAGEGAG